MRNTNTKIIKKMEKIEIWKSISGFEGLYEVSSLGRIKALSKKVKRGAGYMDSKEIILSPRMNRGGYYQYGLTKNGKSKNYRVHRLVAEAFIENHLNKGVVNHKDGNKRNNNVDNLEWCTSSENNKHAYQNKLRVVTDKQKEAVSLSAKKLFKFNEKLVLNKETGIFYNSLKEASVTVPLHYVTVIKRINLNKGPFAYV